MKSVMNLLDGVMMAGLAEAMALTEQVCLHFLVNEPNALLLAFSVANSFCFSPSGRSPSSGRDGSVGTGQFRLRAVA